tara:strand:+ start:16 stop:405 length:390 start_codon:yes stop_codon:yes gene_type:complete
MINFLSISRYVLILILFSVPKLLYAQIDQIDVNSKEYVEWVGTCETPEIEKAMNEGLESLTTIERARYYIDTRRCKYKNQSKIVHSQVDKKQLREDSIESRKFKGKSSSITYCVASFLLYLTLTNGQKQ